MNPIREGRTAHAFNRCDVAGILAMIRKVGALVGAADKAGRGRDIAASVRGDPLATAAVGK